MSDQKEELSKSEDSPIVPTIAAVTVDLESTADADSKRTTGDVVVASESKNAEEQIHIASASDSGGYFTDMEGVHEMIKWIKTRIQVAGYNASTMWKDDVHSSIVTDFLYQPSTTRLFAFVPKNSLDRLVLTIDGVSSSGADKEDGVSGVGGVPRPSDAFEFQYFVRGPSVVITPSTIQKEIVFGVCSGTAMASLLRVMSNLFVPHVSGDKSLPAGVRKSLTDHMHRFMASLTETVHQAHGKTVLYLPSEVVDLENLDVVRGDKDLVQRLESTVIRWTRQIKEVVNLQDNSMNSDAETATPLDEIHFWESRTLDLSGIRMQLEHPKIRRIAEVLSAVKSNYLAPFEELANIIHVGSQEAEDNLKFLSALAPCCQELEEASPDEVVVILPKLMMIVRMIWNLSRHYNRAERLTGLLRKVSNFVMARCCASIPLEGVFGTRDSATGQIGNASFANKSRKKTAKQVVDEEYTSPVDESLTALRQSVKCGEAWREAYRNAALLQNKSKRQPWDFKESSIFAQIDAFVQRCKDLEEVCDGKIQFSRRGSAAGSSSTTTTTTTAGSSTSLPVFGGMQGPSISRAIIGLSQQFERYMSVLRSVTYDVLDVKETQWHTDFNGFKNGVKDLEVMMSNVMSGAFEGLETISACVDMLSAFEKLTKKEAVRKALEKKTESTLILFQSQVANSRQRFDRNRLAPTLMDDEPVFAGAASWARGMKRRIVSDWSQLSSARRWLPSVRQWSEVEVSCDAFVQVLDQYIETKYKDWLQSMEAPDDDGDVDGGGGGSGGDKGQEGSSLSKGLDGHLMIRQQRPEDDFLSNGGDGGGGLVSSYREGMKEVARKNKTTGRLENNFDHNLLRLFNEVRLWDTFEGMPIPYVAHDLANNQNERLRQLREHIMIIVRGYNGVVDSLDTRERHLFTDHVRQMDRRVAQGLVKLNWMHKNIKTWFVPACKTVCDDTMKVVEDYKTGMALIHSTCLSIKRTQLVLIEKNTVYEEGEFEAKQQTHRKNVTAQLQQAHKTIHDTIEALRPSFADSKSPEVQREWVHLVRSIDQRVEAALRGTAKRSLQDLSRAINGDARSEPQPLFKVSVVLDKGTQKIELSPTIITLTQMVNVISKKLLMVLKKIERLFHPQKSRLGYNAMMTRRAEEAAAAAAEGEGKTKDSASSTAAPTAASAAVASAVASEEEEGPGAVDSSSTVVSVTKTSPTMEPMKSFYDVVSEDEDVLKVLVNIMNGMSASGSQLNKVLAYWDKYRLLWEMDRDAFIRRYAKANRPLEQFEIDIQRYRDQQLDIQQEDVSDNITFIRVDYAELKSKLAMYAVDWQSRLTSLLNSNAKSDLQALNDVMDQATVSLTNQPTNLEELGNKLQMLESFTTNAESAAAFDGKFGPVEKKYGSLAKFDVQVSDEELASLSELRPKRDNFTTVLSEAKKNLTKAKQNMRETLVGSLGSFTSELSQSRADAKKVLPFHNDELTPEQALEVCKRQREAVAEQRASLERLKPGLAIFGLEPPTIKNVEDTETDLSKLEAIWGIAASFDQNWNKWKDGKFKELNVESMNTMALQYRKQIGKMKRDISRWKVFGSVQDRVDQFLKTLPLIQDLRNPGLRPRHWDLLRQEMKKDFDPNSPDFTLEKVFTLGVNLHADFIGELSANANKELGIESALNEMDGIWAEVNIEMSDHKEIYYKIRDVEDLFAQLEDNQVSISTMKASRFYQSFREQIDHWEDALSHISEVIELALTVQRQWMYLESIFMASEDIRKQLPKESQLFDTVNATYIRFTKEMYKDPNALRACGAPGLLKTLIDCDENLQVIQKQLDAYLETKRMVFPRFYFLSNDDLLEILGQQKDPKQVQKHIKKCFVGVKKLQLIDPHTPGVNNLTVEAVGMVSPDGEELLANENVVVDGPVELWLGAVEEMMRSAVRRWLRDAIVAYKGTKKKEKWVKLYHGQLLITTGGIMWTAECTRALNQIQNGKKKAMKQLKKQQAKYVVKLAAMVRGKLTRIERNKIIALITMEST